MIQSSVPLHGQRGMGAQDNASQKPKPDKSLTKVRFYKGAGEQSVGKQRAREISRTSNTVTGKDKHEQLECVKYLCFLLYRHTFIST